MIELIYLLIIIATPIIYYYLSNYLKKNLIKTVKTDKYQNMLQFHCYVFSVIQTILSFIILNYLINYFYLFELILALINLYLIYFFYDRTLFQLYQLEQLDQSNQSNESNQLVSKDPPIYLAILFSIPMFLMNLIRNYFDTYMIGLLFFNLNNVCLILWELVIVSLLNTYYFQPNILLIVGLIYGFQLMI